MYTHTGDIDDLGAWIRDEIILERTVSVARPSKSMASQRVQEWLCLHNFPVVIDGQFGPVTELAVKSFQTAKHLTPDGSVGPTTYAALVKPMTDILERLPANNVSYSQSVSAYGAAHLAVHPREIGGENKGPWVRLYMKGEEGFYWPWCAGFVSFLMEQASESTGEAMPFAGSFSVDILARNAKDKGLFVRQTDVDTDKLPAGSVFLVRRTATDWTHTGFVTEARTTSFSTVEGNTNTDGSPNGYEVTSLRRGYNKRDFIVFDDDAPSIGAPIAITDYPNLDVRRHFFDEIEFSTYGSFFACWGGWISAGHVTSAANDMIPPFAQGTLTSWPDGLDAALIGCTLPSTKPPQVTVGQPIKVFGYPAGSNVAAVRTGAVHLERPGVGKWIVRIDEPQEPVTSGMSGGAAIDAATGELVGIIIERNHPANLDNDPEQDHSLNIVTLHDVWEGITNPSTPPIV